MPVCLRFTDDMGNEVFPYKLPYETFMNRYRYYYGYY